jgi:uncharacterized protein
MFLLVITAALVGMHYYLWRRLVRDTALPPRVRRLVTVLAILLAASVPVLLLFRRAPLRNFAFVQVTSWPTMTWLGIVFISFFVLLVADVTRLVVWGVRRVAGARPMDPARRRALRRLFGGTVAAVSGGAVTAAIASALGRVRVKEVQVPLGRLPRALDGTKIVQITDVHIGPTIGRSFVEEVVAEVNALAPDVIAITGDLVDGSPAEIGDAVSAVAGLRARHGVYFVTGNHEYYAGVLPWMDELPRLGVRVLRNERVVIGDDKDSFDLAGIDDFGAGRHRNSNGHRADLPRALSGRDPARELVLLAHQPRAVHEAAQWGVGLQLSGHTHGGQIWPWTYFVYLEQPVVAGLAKIADTWLYVSRGTGYLGPPMRLFAPAEITKLILRAAPGELG